ncbi:MAG: nicotinate-nucleotide--dimethylbenzimidazole phosphoribosyltransferase [Bacteroidota bacterium]
MITFDINPLSQTIKESLQTAIDSKTKPLGALGTLESLAFQIGQIQNTINPILNEPHIIVFAGDHGAAKEGVSAFPQEVTYQMVLNFLHGGAAINVFCQQNKLGLTVVDAGVAADFDQQEGLLNEKVGHGTKSYLSEKAMDTHQCIEAMNRGKKIVDDLKSNGTNIVGFGEMGIGNTSAASLLMSVFCDLDIEQCVGRGTGVNDEQLANKLSVLKSALNYHHVSTNRPFEVLEAFAGFEMVMMAGAMLAAASNKMIIMVDGFIATSAFLAAYHINKNIIDYAIFCHKSDEQGHSRMLQYLKAEPILKMNLRLGEGTGCALAYPLIQSAVEFLNNMASFESAGVSNK